MSILRAVDERLRSFEGGLVILLLGMMVLLAFFQVVLRSVFSSGLVWADILLRHMVLWLGFLGGALATSHQRHIHIDALAHYAGPRVKAILGVVTNLFGAAVCAVLMLASMDFIRGEIETASMMYEGVPAWYAQIIIPVGFALHVCHFLIRSLLSGHAALQKEAGA